MYIVIHLSSYHQLEHYSTCVFDVGIFHLTNSLCRVSKNQQSNQENQKEIEMSEKTCYTVGPRDR